MGKLHRATRKGDVRSVRALLAKKAFWSGKPKYDIDRRDKNGQTALQYASSHGHLSVVELLIDHGASLEDGEEVAEMATTDEIRRLILKAVAKQKLLGVHIDVLRDLHAEAQTAGAITTTEVCNQVVKPTTVARQCAFVDTLHGKTSRTDGRPLVGPATVFISHAWRYNFSDPLDVLLEHAEAHPDAYFWFDLAVNNQHAAPDRPFEWWCTTFRESIASIGTVILVLAPWEDPVPLTRAWCLWEIYSAATTPGVRLEVRLPRAQRSAFHTGLVKDMKAAMNTLVRVQAERADAFLQKDRDNIFAAIEGSCGFGLLNEKVKDQLRAWLLEVALEAASERETTGAKDKETAGLFHNVAITLKDFGDYPKALEFNQKALSIYLATVGDKHPNTASTYHNMAGVYYQQGDYPKALEFNQKALTIRLATVGNKHPDTAVIYGNMAVVYNDQGNYDKALEFYNKALTIKLATVGNKHPNTAITYNNIASVYDDQGNYPKALEFYNKALTIRLAALGNKHPDTAANYNNMANVYEKQGNYPRALEFHKKALTIRLATLGDKHPDTASTYNNMANVQQEQGNSSKALEFYDKALTVRLAALGDKHPDTASTYNNMANVHLEQGDYPKALELYNKALTIRLAALGDKHPDTASTYNNMANVHEGQGDYPKALELYNKALTIRLATLGDKHPDTAMTYNNMAVVYQEQDDYHKALESYNKSLAIYLVTLGDKHPSTADTWRNMGVLHETRNDYSEALKYYRKAHTVALEVLGPDHPDTRQYAQDIRDAQAEL